VFLFVAASFCVCEDVCATSLDDAFDTYFDQQKIDESCAYQVYNTQYKDERAKVLYLINRIRYSDATFIRNNQSVDGYNAGQWLDFKIEKFKNEIITVEDFIEKVGSYSRRSGKPYQAVIDGVRYEMKDIFYNELARLSNYENQVSNAELLQKVNSHDGMLRAPLIPQIHPIAITATKHD
jgi:hypothetical protein